MSELHDGASSVIEVTTFGGTRAQLDDLFDVVAEAAHEWGEERGIDLFCSGTFAEKHPDHT